MKSEIAVCEAPSASVPVASPCQRRCCLNDADKCLGCGRLLAEILEWSGADEGRRLAIRALTEGRLASR
ncbi:DUF1289 domain-containing protein [Pseudomonas seleniipraecipitans]|uniref:DUF1289 domain-containing protein n=1 Tax=Phytopseudomonas seleniipraecipitans TaxID=640205 RepID=A0ABY5J6U3_9GAMM|nr:DUF1289 domain-containing protein [Pseudomonas seleniipraecipitans]UUD62649.1 DUF1289 domain-containing protein [Pseudomonas seleniipraecipitans]